MQLNQVIEWLQGPRAEQTARSVALLLGIWLLYRLALLFWQIVPAPEITEPAVEAVSAAPAAAVRPRLDINEVIGWHLFGAATATEPAPADDSVPVDAPETRLNLILRGVLSSDDKAEARAIIAEPNGTENFFAVGAALPGGAELKEIHADRIILMRAGRYETLRLPKEAMDGADISSSKRDSGPAAEVGALLGKYRDQAAENPRALMDLARAVPAQGSDGRITGFRLFPGNKPALFAQLGLQAGDLVKEVNGVMMDSPMSGAALFKNLRESDQLDLRLERAGEEINLSVAIP